MSTPLDMSERLEEDLGRELLRQRLLPNPQIDQSINPSEIAVVQRPEGFRVMGRLLRKLAIFRAVHRHD